MVFLVLYPAVDCERVENEFWLLACLIFYFDAENDGMIIQRFII